MKSKPANILLLICDQLSALSLRGWGNRYASTPAIDGLAETGMRVETVYTTCPLCQPSRASFWTSRYPHQTGVLSNAMTPPGPVVTPDIPTLGTLFRDAGYHTVHFGKRHDAGALRGFECAPIMEADTQVDHPSLRHTYDTRQDRYTRERTVAFLDSYTAETPFLAVADLNNPHNICDWIGDHRDGLPLRERFDNLPPLPGNLYLSDSEFRTRPLPVQFLASAHRRQAQISQWDEEKIRHYLHAYHYYLSLADREVAAVLDALRRRSDADNTLVVFFSDHGDAMCGRWMATKHTSFYEETMRVPLIFNGPGLGASGHTVRGLCSLLDILPTLCDYAGIPIPKETEGQSLYPALTTGADDASLREAVFAHWFSEWGHTIEPGRMVRTHTYKYTHYREGFGEELYDLSADPGEVANLALKPGYAKVLQKHRVVLDEYIWRTGDPYRNFNYKVDPVFRESYPSYRNYAGPLACDRADLLPAPETLPRLFCT